MREAVLCSNTGKSFSHRSLGGRRSGSHGGVLKLLLPPAYLMGEQTSHGDYGDGSVGYGDDGDNSQGGSGHGGNAGWVITVVVIVVGDAGVGDDSGGSGDGSDDGGDCDDGSMGIVMRSDGDGLAMVMMIV